MKKNDAKVSDLDIAELLDSEEVVKLFLEEALNENDPVLWQRCLGHAARSAGMAKIAEKQVRYSAKRRKKNSEKGQIRPHRGRN